MGGPRQEEEGPPRRLCGRGRRRIDGGERRHFVAAGSSGRVERLVTGKRCSRRELDASAQSAHVAERASAIGRARASTRTIRTLRLSEGVAVEASVLARLLRWRFLTLDASVLLLPANAAPGGTEVTTPRRDPLTLRSRTRGRLSDAIKDIDQAEQSWHAHGRRTSPPRLRAHAAAGGGSLTFVGHSR